MKFCWVSTATPRYPGDGPDAPGHPVSVAWPSEAGRRERRTRSTTVRPGLMTASGVTVDCSTESRTVSPGP